MAPRVFAIVLSWNGRRWIRRCLESLVGTVYPELHICVVDNGSRDGTPEEIEARFPHVHLIRLKRNLGFAGGNNVGIRAALQTGADYVVLLNQDTWVEPDWLKPLVEPAEADTSIGILSPAQLVYEGNSYDQNFDRLLHGCPKGQIIEVPRVIGAALLVKRQVFETVGLFDPIYFAYFEETDFCRRARLRGFRAVVVPAGRIHHWHGLLHPEEMPLQTKILLMRNPFVFALKDPEAGLWTRLGRCLELGYEELQSCVRHPRGLRGGAARGTALAWVALWLVVNLPRVLYHRSLEQGAAAYL